MVVGFHELNFVECILGGGFCGIFLLLQMAKETEGWYSSRFRRVLGCEM